MLCAPVSGLDVDSARAAKHELDSEPNLPRAASDLGDLTRPNSTKPSQDQARHQRADSCPWRWPWPSMERRVRVSRRRGGALFGGERERETALLPDVARWLTLPRSGSRVTSFVLQSREVFGTTSHSLPPDSGNRAARWMLPPAKTATLEAMGQDTDARCSCFPVSRQASVFSQRFAEPIDEGEKKERKK